MSDDGGGIAEADLPHIFDRFYRGADARGRPGTGLGLAIVRQVAEQHGGSVRAANVDGGASFELCHCPGRTSTPAFLGSGIEASAGSIPSSFVCPGVSDTYTGRRRQPADARPAPQLPLPGRSSSVTTLQVLRLGRYWRSSP